MSRNDFISIYKQFFPEGNPETFAGYIFDKFQFEDKFEKKRWKNSHNAEAVFEASGGRGNMSFDEFIISMSVLSRGSHTEKLYWIFHILDNDGDGFICDKDVRTLEKAFRLMIDETDDETIDDNDDDCFQDLTSESKFSFVVDHYDKNNDGKLSWNEFYDAVKTDSKVLRFLMFYEGIV